jgi:hypothetical protein
MPKTCEPWSFRTFITKRSLNPASIWIFSRPDEWECTAPLHTGGTGTIFGSRFFHYFLYHFKNFYVLLPAGDKYEYADQDLQTTTINTEGWKYIGKKTSDPCYILE